MIKILDSRGRRIWEAIRPAAISVLSIVLIVVLVIYGYHFVMDRFIRPVDENDDTPIVVEIRSGLGKSGIAEVLYGETDSSRLIRSKVAFKVYVDFVGRGNRLRAGTYSFSKNMSISEIVNMLVSGDAALQEVMDVTLTEGMTANDMAHVLAEKGAIESEADFLALCKSGEGFETFMSMESVNGDGRIYTLEGYLFPDTYKLYAKSNASTVLNRLLTRFNEIFLGEYVERVEELGMTLDQVITLASIIEKEAKTSDFAKVSAVFHNRMQMDMPLQSDATVKYVLNVSQIYLTQTQLETDTPYNTHLYSGLPAGPICNPGKAAIVAALWPDEQYLEESYLYFTLKEPESGELVFSKTYNEHLKNVDLYRDSWIAYDASAAAKSIITPAPSPTQVPTPLATTPP